MPVFQNVIKPLLDLVVTLLLWAYFIFGYLAFFAPLFIGAFLFNRNREQAFQTLIHLYCRSFLGVVRLLIPGVSIHAQEDVRRLRASIVICNHLSYLDPLLLISLFKRHTTIVKSIFFRLPIFGAVLKLTGYLPSRADGVLADLVIERMDKMGDFLSSGGILFIFPEGTRSRDGGLAQFKTGAFRIANRCQAPIRVVSIRNTQKLFRPDRFLFNTGIRDPIRLDLVGTIAPSAKGQPAPSIDAQMDQARSMLETGNSKLETRNLG